MIEKRLRGTRNARVVTLNKRLARRPAKTCLASLIGLTALVGAGTPPGASPVCSVAARIADPDPRGTNVRAHPGPNSAILARIPHEVSVVGDTFSPELVIIGFERGWAQVRSIHFADYGMDEPPPYQGEGWISGKLLSGNLQTALRTQPETAASLVAESPDGDELETAIVERIDDCRGRYAHVAIRLPNGKRLTGWTDLLCPNQVTTCA